MTLLITYLLCNKCRKKLTDKKKHKLETLKEGINKDKIKNTYLTSYKHNHLIEIVLITMHLVVYAYVMA